MSERRVQLPEAAEDFVMDGLDTSDAAVALFAARKLAQWLVANPQVPTDEQIEELRKVPIAGSLFDIYRRDITEFQRRFLFAPAEPEDPCVCDLLWKSNPFPNTGAQHRHDSAVREAFRRGQQSMIKK